MAGPPLPSSAAPAGAARWRAPLLLALAITAFYLPSARNGFVYDDHEVIRAQPRPTRASDLLRVFGEPHFRGLPYYRPVTRATLLGQKALHGDQPVPFHVGNALLAGAAAAAALAVLRAPALALPGGLALLAAALFLLHPAASSVVYPIASGRETLLPAVAMLGALAAWLHGRRGAAHLALAVALLAKEQAVVVPLLFAAADLAALAPGAPPARPAAARAWAARHAPSAVLLACYLAVRSALFGGSEWELALRNDPAGPLLSLLHALQTGVAPFVALVYEPEVATWLSLPRLALAAAALAALAWAARRSAAPPRRVTLFWVAWFVLAQLPTANLLRQEARFDERYAFLALLALPALAAGVVAPWWGSARGRHAIAAAAGALALALGAISQGRAAAFRDDDAFAAAWLRSDPGQPEALHLLGATAAARGDLETAIAHYRAALLRAPASADLHANLGAALAAQGREHEALETLEAALRLDPGHPEALVNRGVLLARRGRHDEAIAAWRAALRSDPARAAAHARLGEALAARGAREEARAHLREALRLDPADARVRHLLAVIEAQGAP